MQSIIDFILSTLQAFQFWVVIDEYERGVLMRLGRYERNLKPGFHFIYPLYIDNPMVDSILVDTEQLSPQTLDTHDRIGVVVTGVIKWHIEDIKLFQLTAEDCNGVITDIVSTLIAEKVTTTTYDEIFLPDFWKAVTVKARRDAKAHGMYIDKVRYSDLSEVKTIRIIGDGSNYVEDDEE